MKLTACFLALASAVAAGPALVLRDTFSPPVTSPTTGTEWVVNSTQTVTWDTSNPPATISNQFQSSLRLRTRDSNLPIVLADQFDILLGQIDVVVPWVVEGDDYVVVLFGSSDNWSAEFSITGGPVN